MATSARSTRRQGGKSSPAANSIKRAPVEKRNKTKEQTRTKSSASTAGDKKRKLEIPVEIPESLKDLPQTAAHIVYRAASILEKELASGIAAAKDVEERFIDVTKARSNSSNELLQKFREHVHAAVDIGVDLVYAASKSATNISEGAVSFSRAGQTASKEAPVKQSVPTVSINGAMPGNSSRIEMTLENGSDKPTDEFRFYVSDLVSSAGTRIPASQISFEPASLVIKPKQSEKVAIVVSVPKETSPGVYSGLIQATNFDQLQALLSINVQ